MKILITGGSGLLGGYLNLLLSKSNDILTIYNNNQGNCKDFNSAKVDITDYKNVEEIFSSFRPDVVVHTAAVSSPQKASDMPSKLVYRINVNAAKNLAELCESYKAKLIYTSTDLVYAGYRGSMLNEDAKLIPVSLYAETKLMGEQKISETFDNYLILRTALLYGFGIGGSKNHFHDIYLKLKNGQQVKLFSDQFRTPLALADAARMIEQLCTPDIKKEIINFGGKERVSRFELGERLCEAAKFDKSLIEKISMNDITDIPLVADVSMNTDKLQSFGIMAKSIDESLKEILSIE
ncbi:MAG: SDR family oxidoreductase [Ignavibacteriaceae bacterium]